MKFKKSKQTAVILAIVLAFFLGRESKGFNTAHTKPQVPQASLTYASINETEAVYSLILQANDTVYRCGKSKIYHPTLQHGSFKRCKSKITKLTVKQAGKLGMRHCKCSG